MHGNVPAVVFSDVASTLRAGAGAPKHNSDVKGRLVYGFKSRNGAKARSIGLGTKEPIMNIPKIEAP